MISIRQSVTVRDLIDESKKRLVLMATYSFTNSISIIETLSVNSATNVPERNTEVGTAGVDFVGDPLSFRRELSDGVIKKFLSEIKNRSLTDGSKTSKMNVVFSLGKLGKQSEDFDSDLEISVPSRSRLCSAWSLRKCYK